jgi:hypothetical protein
MATRVKEAMELINDPARPSPFTEDERSALEDLPRWKVRARLDHIAQLAYPKDPEAKRRESDRLKKLRQRHVIRFGTDYVLVHAGPTKFWFFKNPDGSWRWQWQREGPVPPA